MDLDPMKYFVDELHYQLLFFRIKKAYNSMQFTNKVLYRSIPECDTHKRNTEVIERIFIHSFILIAKEKSIIFLLY